MKLITDIRPRKDGTVIAVAPASDTAPSGRYVFVKDSSGKLSCDVTHDAHIGRLLDTGFFYPAEESDIGAGIEAVAQYESPKRAYKKRGR